MHKSVYVRPNKPLRTIVKEGKKTLALDLSTINKPLEVSKHTECHVTPLEIAGRMVDYLDVTADMMTLEPSAGTGNIVKTLLNAGHSKLELLAIEQSYEIMREFKKQISVEVSAINSCFLEYSKSVEGKIHFPRIIMNPPYKQVKKHIHAALSLLGANGHHNAVLVALVPITFEHPEAELMEILPDDTFPHIKINTKIIRVER